MFKGFADGMWTPDLAVLNLPVAMMQIYAIVIKTGVDPEDIKLYNDRSSQLKGMTDLFAMLPEDKKNKYYTKKSKPTVVEDEEDAVKLGGLLGEV
jgi:hypothetical protein